MPFIPPGRSANGVPVDAFPGFKVGKNSSLFSPFDLTDYFTVCLALIVNCRM
jgi:hypothetical protein